MVSNNLENRSGSTAVRRLLLDWKYRIQIPSWSNHLLIARDSRDTQTVLSEYDEDVISNNFEFIGL